MPDPFVFVTPVTVSYLCVFVKFIVCEEEDSKVEVGMRLSDVKHLCAVSAREVSFELNIEIVIGEEEIGSVPTALTNLSSSAVKARSGHDGTVVWKGRWLVLKLNASLR